MCGAVWRPRSIAYRCLVCEVNPNSAVCVDCFRSGEHAGHDYRIVHTNGGCCDCGNTSAWKSSGFCSKHGVQLDAGGEPIYQPSLPPKVRDDLDSLLRVALERLGEDVSGAMRDGPIQELWNAGQRRGPLDEGGGAPRPAGMSDATDELIKAARNGDAIGLQRAIERSAVLDAKDDSAFQTTALHWAAQGGHVSCVRKLLAAGASVNRTNAYRQTALHCVVFEGHVRPRGQRGRLGGAISGHHGLVRLPRKARGRPPHSGGEAERLGSHREAVASTPGRVQDADFAAFVTS